MGGVARFGLRLTRQRCWTRTATLRVERRQSGGEGGQAGVAPALGLVLEYFEYSCKRWAISVQQFCVSFAKCLGGRDLA